MGGYNLACHHFRYTHPHEALMENIFSLNYPEYATINRISKIFKKAEYSVFIPVSRQQKGVDFIIQNNKHPNQTVRFQVKSSKVYPENNPKPFKNKFYDQTLTPNNLFYSRGYKKGDSDYYLFFGIYPFHPKHTTKKSRKLSVWKEILLCFDEKFLLDNIDKTELFLYFHFNLDEKGKASNVFATRGFKNDKNITDYLIDKIKLKNIFKRIV